MALTRLMSYFVSIGLAHSFRDSASLIEAEI